MEDNSQLKKLNFIKRKDWLILAAVVLLCAAMAVWGFFGIIQTTVTTTGTSFSMDDGNIYVAVSVDSGSLGKIEEEITKARIIPDWISDDGSTYLSGTVSYVSLKPMNSSEIDELTGFEGTGDFLTADENYAYVVLIRPDKENGAYVLNNGEVLSDFPDQTICEVIIIIAESSPYEIITGGGQ